MAEVLPSGVARFARLLSVAKRYHRHRTIGTEHVPIEGGVLVVLQHSFATYDGFLPALDIYEERGRIPAGLGDDLIFKVPGLGRLARSTHIYPASHDNAVKLLAAGRLVYVAPGGMREALRPSDEKHAIRWANRKGFIRLSIRTGAPIVLGACHGADDIFTVYRSRLTDLAYRRLKLPLAAVRGWGPTLMPRPVQLTHILAEPIYPPEFDEAAFDAQVQEHHALVCDRMEALLGELRRADS